MIDQIEKNFKQHSVEKAEGLLMDGLRLYCKNLAFDIDAVCPDSREKSLAMTKLEEVMFWANASIARNQKAED